MNCDVAIRLDGMLIGARAGLDAIAHHMKNKLSSEEYSRSIGRSMGAAIEISSALHAQFPDIVPKELIPPGG